MLHRHSIAVIAATLMTFAIAACAHSSAGAAVPCQPLSRDTLYLKGGIAYRDCAVEVRARALDRPMQPVAELQPTSANDCYSAEIEFVVDTAGYPELETATVLRTTNPTYAHAVISALPNWHYRPAQLHGMKVRQIVVEKPMLQVQLVAAREGEPPHPQRGKRC